MQRSLATVILLVLLLSCSKEGDEPVISYSPAEIHVGTAVSFYAHVGNPYAQCTWVFGDGHSDGNAGPSCTHTYTDAGDYYVEVDARDTSGNYLDSETIRITVKP